MSGASKKLLIESVAVKNAASIYRAIYHPLRLQMIETIHQAGRINVTPLIRKFKLEQSLVSLHLRILRDAKLVNTDREGRVVYYSVNYNRINHISELTDKLIPRKGAANIYPHLNHGPSSKFSRKGGVQLSPTELKIIRMVCEQKTSDDMAGELQLSKRTVEDYRASILKKTQSRNSVGILIYAVKNGLFKL